MAAELLRGRQRGCQGGVPPTKSRSLKEWVGVLRNLWPFILMVWRTSPQLTAASLLLRLCARCCRLHPSAGRAPRYCAQSPCGRRPPPASVAQAYQCSPCSPRTVARGERDPDCLVARAVTDHRDAVRLASCVVVVGNRQPRPHSGGRSPSLCRRPSRPFSCPRFRCRRRG